MTACRTVALGPVGRLLHNLRGKALEVTAAADVDPTVFAHKQCAEHLDGGVHVPTLGHEVPLHVQLPGDHLQQNSVGIFVGQRRNLSGLGRDDLDGSAVVHAESPLYDVEGVDRVTGQVAPAKVAAELPGHDVRRSAVMMKSTVERTPRGRAEPEVPIQALGHGFAGEVHVSAGARRDYIDDLDFSNRTVLNEPASLAKLMVGPLLQPRLEHAAIAADRPDHGLCLADGQRGRLFTVDILARGGRQNRCRCVPIVAGGNHYGVDVAAGKQFAQIVVCPAAVIRSAGRPSGVRLFNCSFGVLSAPAVDVANGDDLGVRISQKAAHVTLAHHADADEADGDSLARRECVILAQRRRGHNERGCRNSPCRRSESSQNLPSAVMWLLRLAHGFHSSFPAP